MMGAKKENQLMVPKLSIKTQSVRDEVIRFLEKHSDEIRNPVSIGNGNKEWIGREIGFDDLNVDKIKKLGGTGCLIFQEDNVKVGKLIRAGEVVETIVESQIRMTI
jgi:hypothetical protein